MIILTCIQPTNNSRDLQIFCKELLVTKQAKDDNVLAIEGVQIIGVHTLCIVSKWMDNGNLLAYLEGNEDANHADLVRPPPRSQYLFADSLGVVVWRGEGTRLLALHRSNPWGS